MKNLLLIIALIWSSYTRAQINFAHNLISYLQYDTIDLCATEIGGYIHDFVSDSAVFQAAFMTLDSVRCNYFAAFFKDSLVIQNGSCFNELDTYIPECPMSLTITVPDINKAIIYIDVVDLLLNNMLESVEILEQVPCEESGRPALENEMQILIGKMELIQEFRDTIETNLTGQNLAFFNFHKPQNLADINQFYVSANQYISLLNNTQTCEQIENRLGGRLDFLIMTLLRLIDAHYQMNENIFPR
jgi:hypothetical protein